MKNILISLLITLPSVSLAQDKVRMIKTHNNGKLEVVMVDANAVQNEVNNKLETDVLVETPKKRPKLYSNIEVKSPYSATQTAKDLYSVNSGSKSDYVPSDPYFEEQVHWLPPSEQYFGYNNILTSVQRLSPMRRPVVGIIDSGFYAHPDLIYADGYNMVSIGDAERSEDYFMREGHNTEEDNELFCIVHGTGVAAVAVATRDNDLGFAGIADGDFLASRSMECGFGYLSDSSDSILWQIGQQVDDIRPATLTADVINMSLGGVYDDCPNFMQEAITQANDAGVPVIVAIGNHQIDAAGFTPTNCEGTINVAPASREGDLFKTSNFGTRIDIVALGDNVASATAEPDGIGWWEESSFAAPIVTGVIANAVAELGKLTNAEIKFFLSATAKPFAAGQCDDSNRCGAGIMDATAFHNAIRDYKKGSMVSLQPALSNTEFCEKDLYATDENELARLCETYELVLPQHQSNRTDIRFEVMAFDKGENMAHANGELVATSTSARMLLSTLDMSSNDYGVRMCNSERCFGATAIKITDNSAELPAICN